MSATQEYLTLCREEQWRQGLLWQTECAGDSIRLAPDAFWGAACLSPVDSGENGFQWSRVKLTADLPRDAGIRIYARASDDARWPEWAVPEHAENGRWLADMFGASVSSETDAWLAVSGRYLWLAVELTAGGAEGPRLDAVSLRMSGDHMVDYLPSIYRGQDFTYRYLSIFNSMFQDMERSIDELSRQLDVSGANEEMLDFLARWLCVRPDGNLETLREQLPDALRNGETMYTVEGIRRSAKLLCGREPYVIEHFTVDSNSPDCRNPALYRRLYGEDPYRFFLLFPQDTFASQSAMEYFLDWMQDLIPAETELELVLLKPCVQLDWHTYLGINSQIGSYIPAAINENVTIHYDMTIGGTDHEQ